METLINDLTKIRRIKLLNNYKLNTPNYVLIKKASNPKEIDKYLTSFKNISIRTQNPNAGVDLNLPKYINIGRNIASQKVKELIRDYDVLITEAISPTYCTKCGNIALLKKEIIIEVVYGAGTLDRLTRQGQVDNSWSLNYYNYHDKLNELDILQILKSVIKIPFRDVIIEFSIFSKEIGIRNKNYVVWEIINY